MKNFFKFAVLIKYNAGLFSMAAFFVILLINLITGKPEINASLAWQVLLLGMTCGTLQCLAYSDIFIKKMSFVKRSLLSTIPLFIILSICAYVFKWFPVEFFGYWITFALIFIVIFAACLFSFSLYFKVTGEKFNEKLIEFKGKNK